MIIVATTCYLAVVAMKMIAVILFIIQGVPAKDNEDILREWLIFHIHPTTGF